MMERISVASRLILENWIQSLTWRDLTFGREWKSPWIIKTLALMNIETLIEIHTPPKHLSLPREPLSDSGIRNIFAPIL